MSAAPRMFRDAAASVAGPARSQDEILRDLRCATMLAAIDRGHAACGNRDVQAAWYVGGRLVCDGCAPAGRFA